MDIVYSATKLVTAAQVFHGLLSIKECEQSGQKDQLMMVTTRKIYYNDLVRNILHLRLFLK